MSSTYLQQLELNKIDRQTTIDRLFNQYKVQPVGTGYIDCIITMPYVGEFIDKLTIKGIVVHAVTWWYHCSSTTTIENNCPLAMGGPKSTYWDGWFSEMMIDLKEFETTKLDELPLKQQSAYVKKLNQEIKTYILAESVQNQYNESCLVPALWLYVPDDWNRL